MLNENMKNLRKARGMSQEELAVRLHVVRQTVSKWERGISVPDAETLAQIAEIFEVSVEKLLGITFQEETQEEKGEEYLTAEYLSRINAQLVERNQRSRKIWRMVKIVLLSCLAATLLLILLNVVSFDKYETKTQVQVEESQP